MDWQTALILILGFLLVITWAWGAGRVRRGNMRRLHRAQDGESRAERLLTARGYQILDRQVTERWALHIDGTPVPVSCRADLLVGRGRRRYIAEVKTGARAPDPTNPATRRQLLEYLLAFEVDGVLLIDMESEAIRKVDYPWTNR